MELMLLLRRCERFPPLLDVLPDPTGECLFGKA
jgi:hypothetical protein